MTRRTVRTLSVAAALAGVVVATVACSPSPTTDNAGAPTSPRVEAQADRLVYERLADPARTVVRHGGDVVAVLTDTARTVVLNGPRRSFSEPQATKATVNTSSWVRLLPQPWRAGAEQESWFTEWFAKARGDTSPDVLAVATEYLAGKPDQTDANGVRFSGDASFGPVKASGAGRQEQSDFYDYLGVPWQFPDGPDAQPERGRYGSVDCSGYVRLVYGYRLGMPLLGTNTAGPGIPRRAYAISEFGPGVPLVPHERRRATDYGRLQPGDLVFFEIEDDPDTLDHVGIYLGLDDGGHHRFISSRERINGPTLGDVGGTSLLDDGGFYSTAWRSARRL
ncbi:NlpC/P60 family protein [Saccharothrix variisporea]|uniref:NlpC/P60 family protein n=1 Tax=Saccharothrix variisporea TaxID=543527 RepID=A0A495XK98_9PSEU|nr:NlpC/P60 family protein [Saccharothrix variisporea]RKT74880.1 NlpC/P60 family protein [Saccharothrix variisporea]